MAALYCHTRTRLVQSLVVFDGIDDDDGGGDGDGNEEDAMNVMTVMMMRFSCSVMCGGSGRDQTGFLRLAVPCCNSFDLMV